MANKITGATIPYQLRPLKAIERNLFVELLKRLDSSSEINLSEYRYVGFGAAFLEDFKQLHLALHISDMDCIEMDGFAYTRQQFNNPYKFVNLYNESSTDYINEYFKSDKGQIIWLDYAAPRFLAQQLLDIELLCAKLAPFDIIKFTFNARLDSFIKSHGVKNEKKRFCHVLETTTILEYIKSNDGFKNYLPPSTTHNEITHFDQLIRAMCMRAIERGLSKLTTKMDFLHLSAFSYADGQEMTTITGIICQESEIEKTLTDTKVDNWPFLTRKGESEFVEAIEIMAPVMTPNERLEIDRWLSDNTSGDFASKLDFRYGTDDDEHQLLIDGYRRFYRYLPYYSKVIY